MYYTILVDLHVNDIIIVSKQIVIDITLKQISATFFPVQNAIENALNLL